MKNKNVRFHVSIIPYHCMIRYTGHLILNVLGGEGGSFSAYCRSTGFRFSEIIKFQKTTENLFESLTRGEQSPRSSLAKYTRYAHYFAEREGFEPSIRF